MLQLSMFDFLFMIRMKLPFVDRIQTRRNKFAIGVENKATRDSKLNAALSCRDQMKLKPFLDWSLLGV